MPDEFLRVKDKDTGHEFTIPAGRFNPEAQQKVDKPALGSDGTPAGVKYRTKLGTPRPGSKQARKRATPKKTTSAATAAPGESDGQSAAPEEES